VLYEVLGGFIDAAILRGVIDNLPSRIN